MGNLDKSVREMVKWDYKVFSLKDAQLKTSENRFKGHGNGGFELVSVIRLGTNENIVIFKKWK